jgi:membrane protein implicated in regulation of membrane protease activity
MPSGIDPGILGQLEPFAHVAVVMLIIALAFFLVWFVTIIDIVRSQFTNNTDKIIWFCFLIVLPPIGVLLYFFIGRHQKRSEYKFNRRTRYRDIGRE